MRITQDDVGYFLQEYSHNFTAAGGAISTNGNYSMPVRFFDFIHRGTVIYFRQRSAVGNDNSSERTVCEFHMPSIDNAGGSPTGANIRYRVRTKEGTGGATGAIRLQV